MSRLIEKIKQKKMVIVIVFILLICSIAIAIGVYAQITNQGTKKNKEQENIANYEELKNNFQEIFTNKVNIQTTLNKEVNYNEIVKTKDVIQEKEDGKYSIDAKIPIINVESEVANKINQEIIDVFENEITKIKNQSNSLVIYNLDYTAYVNENIVSLVIMCKYKNGKNPQRIIIQCYNYDIKNDKLLNIRDIIKYKNLDIQEMQDKIDNEISKINTQNQTIKEQGYNVYLRDINSEIYQINNAPNFFLGENNYLYLVYAYGNKNYTSEMDLIIF